MIRRSNYLNKACDCIYYTCISTSSIYLRLTAIRNDIQNDKNKDVKCLLNRRKMCKILKKTRVSIFMFHDCLC